ncbi:sporulation protein [Jeotgalibacillus aurantiacus]|uniref:sporulation protein n=1 Tax=Jeotgalibacillus aurantiacus TaxID=2763266 RepID=UPI001D09B65A|nr:sporulation protein [Jeotgalibacillus aurantiacus]
MLARMISALSPGKGKVDLVLNQNTLTPGEKITGTFRLKGPKQKAKVSRLECDLMKFDPDSKEEKAVEIAATIYMSQEIDDKEWKELPFTYVIPEHLAQHDEKCRYRFRTRLIFKNNVQYIDHDELKAEEKKND